MTLPEKMLRSISHRLRPELLREGICASLLGARVSAVAPSSKRAQAQRVIAALLSDRSVSL